MQSWSVKACLRGLRKDNWKPNNFWTTLCNWCGSRMMPQVPNPEKGSICAAYQPRKKTPMRLIRQMPIASCSNLGILSGASRFNQQHPRYKPISHCGLTHGSVLARDSRPSHHLTHYTVQHLHICPREGHARPQIAQIDLHAVGFGGWKKEPGLIQPVFIMRR